MRGLWRDAVSRASPVAAAQNPRHTAHMTDYPRYAYKLLSSTDRVDLETHGKTTAAVDLADGYVHLSTKEQLAETAMKYFAGERGCLLLEIDLEARSDVKCEASRGGALFPHIYGDLLASDPVRNWEIDVPETGTPNLPDDLK